MNWVSRTYFTYEAKPLQCWVPTSTFKTSMVLVGVCGGEILSKLLLEESRRSVFLLVVHKAGPGRHVCTSHLKCADVTSDCDERL